MSYYYFTQADWLRGNITANLSKSSQVQLLALLKIFSTGEIMVFTIYVQILNNNLNLEIKTKLEEKQYAFR